MSLFETCFATTPCDGLTLADLVAGIREGRWKAEVELYRSLLASGESEDYKGAKKRLPGVMLSARVKHRKKGTSPEQREAVHSGFLQIDLDGKDNPGRNPGEIAETLKAIPWIVAVFISPSGNGVKAIARCPADFDRHAGSWHAAATVLERHGLKIDSQTKKWDHLCFVSYDPKAWLREGEAAEIVPAEMLPSPISEPHRASGTVRPEFAREKAAELAAEGGRPDREKWVNISSAFFHGCGVDTGIEILEEAFPPEEEGEYQKLARTLSKFIPWETLRSFGVDPIDPEELIADMPDCSEDLDLRPKDDDPGTSGFPITRAGEMEGTSEALDFVEGLLTEGGGSVVYGPSNCGKTFWAIDLAVHVATGATYRGSLEVDQGAVVYVALEGSHGAKNRIEALKRWGRLPEETPLFLCFAPVSLLNSKHAKKLAASVKAAAEQSGLPCRLVILDTLARAMAGGDENSGKDMGDAVKSMDAIRAATGANVMLIHHCGKNEALGARGHSSLRAAVDTEIEISRPEGEKVSTVRVTKQRDLPAGDPMPFSLEPVTLGMNRRGKPITSCLVNHEDVSMASRPGRAGRKAKCTPEEMLALLPAENAKDWKDRVNEELGLGASQFYENKKRLESMGKTRREEGSNRILAVLSTDLPVIDDVPEE
jgi:hypothetical protein